MNIVCKKMLFLILEHVKGNKGKDQSAESKQSVMFDKMLFEFRMSRKRADDPGSIDDYVQITNERQRYDEPFFKAMIDSSSRPIEQWHPFIKEPMQQELQQEQLEHLP